MLVLLGILDYLLYICAITMEKILICAPTAAIKNYCAEEWLLNINKFTYSSFEVVVYDNTPDNGDNMLYLNELAQSLCLKYDFKVVWDGCKGGLIERLCSSHNQCRHSGVFGNYKHILHLETDVMPEPDVIERLLAHNKQVCGALYYRDEGRFRKLMIQRHVVLAERNIKAVNVEPDEDAFFIDGTLKKVAHVGLGCVLIHKSVFSKIPFRFIAGRDTSPDSYFAEDCFKFQIPIYADTSLICAHKNVAWGKYGEDYN